MPHSNLSIAEAIREVEKRRFTDPNNSLESSVPPPIDIVAVCFAASLSISGAPVCKKSSNYQKMGTGVDILLADYTIPMKNCVRVKLRGTTAVNAFLSKKIHRGNVLRLNGLLSGTRIEDNSTGVGRKRRAISCGSTAYEIMREFQQSWTNPDTGLNFVVLSSSPRASPEPGVSGMETSPELIRSLNNWYCEKVLDNCNTNDVSTTLSMQSSDQNCRKMTLSEITAADVLCNVLVRVRGFDRDAIIANGKCRRNRAQLHEKTSFALLVDGQRESDMISLHHCCRFRHLLQDAQDKRIPIQITRVLSQQFSSGDLRDIYLVPTLESTVSICEDIELMNKGKDQCNFSQTQPMSYSPSKTPSQEYPQLESQIFEQKEVISKIIDVFVVGKSVHLSRSIFRFVPSKLSSVLIDKCEACSQTSSGFSEYKYCRAILTLSMEESSEDKVLINAENMKKICCGVEPSDLAPNADPIYKQLVCDILLGLIEEKKAMHWKLEKRQTDEKWSVLDVKLICL